MSWRQKRWIIFLLICVALVIGAVLLFKHWTSSSAIGSVRVGTPTSQADQIPQPLALKTAYFTTTLPAGFILKRQTETPGAAQILLQLFAASEGMAAGESFAATVGTLPSGGLSGIGDYNLRATDTTAYAPYSPPGLPVDAVAFRTASGSNAFVVFWPHQGKYAELAISTDAGVSLTDLSTVFTQVMSAWSWL